MSSHRSDNTRSESNTTNKITEVRRVKSKTSGGVADDNKVDRDKWNIEISAVEEMTVNRAKDNSERRKSKLREEEREEEELKTK